MQSASTVLAAREQKQIDRAAELHGDGSVKLTDQLESNSKLVSRVRQAWHRNRNNKTIVEKRMLDSLRARKGVYSPEKLADIRQAGGSEMYVKLTTAKVRTAIAHMKAVMLPQGTWSHGVKPTKEPRMPNWMAERAAEYLRGNPMFNDENGNAVPVEQQADQLEHMIRVELGRKSKEAARRMERKIYDQLQEGGWRKAISDFIDDLCTYQAAFMKGPYVVNSPRLTWDFTPDGTYELTRTIEPTLMWRTIDPFDAYPAPGVDSVHKGDFIERMRMSKSELYAMRNTPDVYDVDAINRVLELDSHQRLDNWLWTDSERQRVADHASFWYAQSSDFDALHWYGEAMGYELIEHGVPASEIEDLNRPYQVDAILIGNEIIKATLNRDPLYRRNINSSCYENTPGSVFGNSIYDLMDDSASMVNSTARALQNNLAHASGFQVEVDYTRLHPNTDPHDIHPFKIWQGKESEFSGDRPVTRFFQPDSNASELIAVMTKFAGQADVDTGIPQFLHGGTDANAPDTARATGMLKDDAAKILRSAMTNVDEDVISPILRFVYDHNMLNDPDHTIKGDTQVVPRGMLAALQREGARQQHMAVLDLLGNPEDRELLGEDRRLVIIRNMLDTFEEIDTDEVLPSDDELRYKLEARAKQPPPPDPKMIKIEQDAQHNAAKLALEEKKLAADAEQATADQALKLQLAKITQETAIQTSQDDLDKKMQQEITKLRAARTAAHEMGQMEMERDRMKIEAKAREKVQDLRNQLTLERQKQAATPMAESTMNDSPEAIEAAVQAIMMPLVQEFKAETLAAIDKMADMVKNEHISGGHGDINVAVNLPDCKPGKKHVTATRDAQGNLQATISPEDHG